MMPAATNGSHGADDDLVLSGLAGRLPDSDNMEDFAEKLFAGVDLVSADDRRWKPGLHGLPERNGKLKDLEHFDASFFGVHGKQAHLMDPQLRLLLEITHEAIVDAGYAPAELRGTDTGVFVGVSNSETEERWTEEPAKINGYALTGCCRAMFPNRISYTFDLQGPSYAIDTACSSSMFALAQAAAAIRAGHCSAAIVAGCNLCLKPANSLNFHRLSMLSPEGRCAAFDAAGRGYVRSEAAVCVVLQRRGAARRVYATLRGARCNTDGNKAQGITFPSGQRQLALVRDTFREARLEPRDVAYVEAHGTGTKVGDPQEVNAIAEAFCSGRSTPLLLGSVKSNMGHSEPASGLCSIAKVLLAAQRGTIPANLHYHNPNPDIPALHDGRIKVVSKNTPWNGGLVAINSFGFGGANAHVILEAPPRDVTRHDVTSPQATTPHAADKDVPRLVIASGRTEAAVEYMLAHAQRHSASAGLLSLLDHAHYVPTPGHAHRGYALLDGDGGKQEILECEGEARPVWLVFSGMGSQCAGVGCALAKLPGARDALQEAHQALKPEGIDLMHLLTEAPESAFDDLINCFVGIAAVQVALVELLKQVGITPDGIIGHSVGEIGCAYADGTLSVAQAVLAAYWRGRSIADAALPPGAMCATGLSWEEATRRCNNTKLQPACHNAENSVTISGPVADIDAFVAQLSAEGVFARKVASAGVAFHSVYISGCAARLRASLQALIPAPRARSPRWLSTSLPEEQWDSPLGRLSSMEYHVNNLLSPVRFAAALRHVPPRALLVELAPHALLQAVLRRACPEAACVPLLRRDAPPMQHLLSAIGKIFCAGGQPKVGLLYGPTQFPVDIDTPGLGAAVRWDHGTQWSVASFHKARGSEWTSEVDVSRPEDAYLTGHKIDGRVLFPATGYLCLLWRGVCEAAGREWRDTAVLLTDVTFHRATILSQDTPLNFTLHALPDGRQELREGGTTVVTAEARIVEEPATERLPDSLFSATHNGVNGTDDWLPLQAEDIYKELRLRGYEYGGEFRGIERAECGGATGSLKWAGNWVSFMDCMLQFGIVGTDVRELYLPVRLQRALIDPTLQGTAETCQVHHVKGLRVTRAGGVELRGLKTSLAPRRAAPQPAPRLERYSFVPYCSAEAGSSEPGAARRLALSVCSQLLLENAGTLRLRLAERGGGRAGEALLLHTVLDALEGEPQVRAEASVWPTMDLGALTERGVTAKPAAPTDCHLVIAADAMCRGGDKDLRELAAMLNVDGMLLLQEARDAIDQKQHRDTLKCAKLDLIARQPAVTCDFLLVRPTRTLPSEIITVTVDQKDYSWVEQLKSAMKRAETEDIRVVVVGSGSECGVLGLGTCLRQEAGGARARVFLTDRAVDADTIRTRLSLDLAVNVLRGTEWGCYRHLPLSQLADTRLQVEHAYVNTVTRGDLSSLVWLESPLSTHPAPQALARVYCAPLNFRDVMLATGKLPPDALPGSLAQEDCILGLEWSGRLGSGERAMGLVPARGLATTVVPGHFTWRVPAAWTLVQAATVPVAYATAYYALFVRGRARKGESVLIHAAAGAVGQAALALCQHHGLKAFATCSRDKRPVLMKLFPELPQSRIANSRDTSFEQVILRETGGAGVDLVLNSLAGEQLQASLRCLREGGRFLEIGKLDLSQDSKLGMSIFLKNVTFHGILLDALFEGGAESGVEAAEVMSCMEEGLESGAVQPLPATTFNHNQLEEAFRYMATGKHIGKVVLKVREEEATPTGPAPKKVLLPAVPQTYMHPEKTYVLVGGLGGFGLELAGWLVKRGASRLVLVSRSGVTTGYQAWCIRRWRSAGVKVLISKTEATTEAGAMALMREAEALGPVGGVFNLAAVLRDAFLDNQTPEAFRDVARPKIDATEHLDVATRALCPSLEHFVAFSSVSCGRGNAGQTNYGLANSAMERLCERRARHSLPALAVQWGAIGDVGLVMSMSGSERDDMTVGGTVPQRIASCLAALGTLLGQPWPVASSLVLPDRRRANTQATQDIRKQVANILGLKDPDKVNESATLAELGMDSLMGAEIKQTLERAHDLVLGVPEVRALTFAALRALEQGAAAGSGAVSPPSGAAVPAPGDGPVPQFALLERLMPTEPIVELPSAKPDSDKIVFMVGGVEGTADGLSGVSALVQARVLALQCTRAAPLHSLPALAQHYCALVRGRAAPPYVLLGYSYGASVAFEMAAQFEKEGCAVSLTLIDGSPAYVSAHTLRRRRSRGEHADTPRDHADALAYFTHLFTNDDAEKLSSSLEALSSWEERLARATQLVCGASGLEAAAVADAATAFYRKLASALQYKCSRALASGVALFVAERARAGLPPDYGLQEHCRAPLALHALPATHASILHAPHAASIAAHLNSTLARPART